MPIRRTPFRVQKVIGTTKWNFWCTFLEVATWIHELSGHNVDHSSEEIG